MRFFHFVPMIVVGLAMPGSQAAAGPVYQGPNGATFDYYGHLNPAFVSVDDGVATKSFVANNDNSTSRFGFNIRRPVGGSEFRFNFETSLGFPATSQYDNDPATSDPTFNWTQENLRKVDFSIGGDNWGRLSIGQGSTASDGSAEIDLSDIGLTTYVGIGDVAGSFQFRNAAGNALSGISVGSVFSQFDGNGRRCRIRYDTPSLSGFSVAASYGEECLKHNRDEKYTDVALSYENEFANNTHFKARVAWFEQDKSGVRTEGAAGSASVVMPSGLNVTVASGGMGTPSYVYGKIGFKRRFFSTGQTSFGIDYFDGSDYALTGGATSSSSQSWGVGVTQDFDDVQGHKFAAYLGYRNHKFDDNVANYNDIDSVIFGAIWRF